MTKHSTKLLNNKMYLKHSGPLREYEGSGDDLYNPYTEVEIGEEVDSDDESLDGDDYRNRNSFKIFRKMALMLLLFVSTQILYSLTYTFWDVIQEYQNSSTRTLKHDMFLEYSNLLSSQKDVLLFDDRRWLDIQLNSVKQEQKELSDRLRVKPPRNKQPQPANKDKKAPQFLQSMNDSEYGEWTGIAKTEEQIAASKTTGIWNWEPEEEKEEEEEEEEKSTTTTTTKKKAPPQRTKKTKRKKKQRVVVDEDPDEKDMLMSV